MLSFLRQLSSANKDALRGFGRRFGFDIRLNGINSRDDLRFIHFLHHHRIDLVLDVGANIGQFAGQLIDSGYAGDILSFEPQPEEHAALVKAAAPYANRWKVAPCVALSDAAGEAQFNVAEYTTCSSLLAPSGEFVAAVPEVGVNRTIKVSTERLDAFAAEFDLMNRRTMLKLDVQGSEGRVLAGAGPVLSHLQGVIVEASLTRLYAGQPLAADIHQLISSHGFEVWDIWQGYRDPKTWQLIQVDVVYFKPETATAA